MNFEIEVWYERTYFYLEMLFANKRLIDGAIFGGAGA